MAASLKAASLPGNNLAYTNAVFVNPAQSGLIRPTYKDTAFAVVNDLIYEIRSEPVIESGTIGLNALQRTALRVSQFDNLSVKSLAIPPKSNYSLAFLQLEVALMKTVRFSVDEEALIKFVQERMINQIWCKSQIFVIDFQGQTLKLTVSSIEIVDLGSQSEPTSLVRFGVILPETTVISFETNKKDALLTLVKSKSQSRSNILRPSFKFSEMGIGGLDEEFGQIFRRAFASRTFPPEVVEKLGISHVRGMLLHGPPGTGKTLIARQIGKILNGREPKVVNGPEILNKYVGASEENIRKLFEDAEADYAQNKEHSDLHIIIFDEIDAICKQRGTTGGGTGVHDTVVNQLLSKIDGVNSLNNILVIGMTNRKDMIDEALLRPGRLEVHVEIGLPDENGRNDILIIHTKAMRETGCLHADVNIRSLAQRTKNFSGAELAGLVKSAVSFALYGNIDVNSGDKVTVKSVNDILVKMEHFEQALMEIIPAFGVSGEDLQLCLRNGFIEYGRVFQSFMDKCLKFVRHIKESDDTPLVSVLLHGPPGCGKTAIAAQLAIQSDVPFVKLVAPNDYLGYSESEKVSKLMKVFNDAYKSSASIIVLDSIERLLEYTPVGPRFSNAVLQALLVKLTHPPPNAKRRLMIIGTTNNFSAVESMEFRKVFKAVYEVPQVESGEEVKRVLRDTNTVVDDTQLGAIINCVHYPIGIQQLLMVIQLAVRFGNGQLTHENFSGALHNFNLGSPALLTSDLNTDFNF